MIRTMDTESRNLLVELLVEELPPKALAKLGDAFALGVFEQLKSLGLVAEGSACTSYATPRRLAVYVTGVLGQAAAQTVTHKLMPLAVAFKNGVASDAYRKKLAGLGQAKVPMWSTEPTRSWCATTARPTLCSCWVRRRA